jgi:beta-RFAP synthase
MVEGFETVVELRAAAVDRWQADGAAAQADLERATAFVQCLRERTGRHKPLSLYLRQVLPQHSGFGSGTQLALAVGRAFARWQGLDVSTPTLARWLGRGLRSGIGIAGLDAGGLRVVGGPGRRGDPAPVIARLDMPSEWRVVVVQDVEHRGLSGGAEKQAIAALAPLPQSRAAEICHQVLMRVLPGAASGDFAAFAAGIDCMQTVLGEHFMPVQAGSAWSSPAVERVMRWLRAEGGARIAVGQSSWGPTAFAFVPSVACGTSLVAGAQSAGVVTPAVRLNLVAARNNGASVERRAPGQ